MNTETILLHDPDVELRTSIRRILSQQGYRILEAANEQHAEAICAQSDTHIDLIIADTSSRALSKWLEWRPDTPVLSIGHGPSPELSHLQTPRHYKFVSKVSSVLNEQLNAAKDIK